MANNPNGLNQLDDDELNYMAEQIELERQRRQQQQRLVAEENMLSETYHRHNPPALHNGVPVWEQPLMSMMGYYSGAVVWHEGEGWQNDQPGVNITEPGAEGHTWTSWADAGTWVGDELPPTDNETPDQTTNPEPEPAPELEPEPEVEPEVDNPPVIDVN